MRAFRRHSARRNGEAAENELLRERLEKAELPDEVREEADRELKRRNACRRLRRLLTFIARTSIHFRTPVFEVVGR